MLRSADVVERILRRTAQRAPLVGHGNLAGENVFVVGVELQTRLNRRARVLPDVHVALLAAGDELTVRERKEL